MSRLFAGVLLALPSMVGSYVLAATMVLTPTSPAPVGEVVIARATSEHYMAGDAPRRVRDIDMTLYRAHWQLYDAPTGCFDPGPVDRRLEAATAFSLSPVDVLRAGIPSPF